MAAAKQGVPSVLALDEVMRRIGVTDEELVRIHTEKCSDLQGLVSSLAEHMRNVRDAQDPGTIEGFERGEHDSVEDVMKAAGIGDPLRECLAENLSDWLTPPFSHSSMYWFTHTLNLWFDLA